MHSHQAYHGVAVVLFLTVLGADVHAACNPPNPPDTYNFYPGTGYPSGSVATYPWQTPAGTGFDAFETYANGSVIERSANKALQNHLEVTSGTLTSRYVGAAAYRRAKTETFNFRMLLQGLSRGTRVKWTNQAIEARFYVEAWQASDNDWQGVHLFGRYRTEDDLYVASLRRDGTTLIQRKRCGDYTRLATGWLTDARGARRSFNTRQWYTLTFSVVGNQLKFFVDDVEQLAETDGTFSWGTMGIRTDYANVYVDDVLLSDR
jgi:hypothetical protein